MTQKGTVSQLLPLQTVDKADLQERWDYIYEPDAVEILDGLLMRYIESQVSRARSRTWPPRWRHAWWR